MLYHPRPSYVFLLLALAAACMSDAPLEPTRQGGDVLKPSFNHLTVPALPPLTVDVNNYRLRLYPNGVLHDGRFNFELVLFGGGPVALTDQSHIANGYDPRFGSSDFPAVAPPLRISSSVAAHQTVTVFEEIDDNWPEPKAGPLGLTVVRETFAWSGFPDDDYLIVKYTLVNVGPSTLTGLTVGEILDEDVGYALGNSVKFVNDGSGGFSIATGPTSVVHGHGILSHPLQNFSGWGSSSIAPPADPVSNDSLFGLLTGGIGPDYPLPAGTPVDTRSAVTTSGLSIPAGGSLVVATVLAGGFDEAGLTGTIGFAREKWASLPTSATDPYPKPVPLHIDVQIGTIKTQSRGDWMAKLIFQTTGLAGMVDPASVRCGRMLPFEVSPSATIVALKFHLAEFDPQVEPGDELTCAGTLIDGTIFFGSDVPTIERKGVAPVTTLTSGFKPTFSPDGNSIAFEQPRDNCIWLLDLKSGVETRLVCESGGSRQPDWSPDGSTILFVDEYGSLYTIPARGGPVTELLPYGSGVLEARWSPDGDRIVVSREVAVGTSDLWVMNSDGTGLAPLTNGTGWFLYPDWAEDGLIYFSNLPVTVLSIDPLQGASSITQVVPPEGVPRQPTLSPDGKTLAFVEGSTAEIVFQNMDTGEHTVLVMDPFRYANGSLRYGNLEFSPDGRTIVFTDRYNVYLADVSKVR